MNDLRELYQELILDHTKRPRNFRAHARARTASAEGHNPLCGDRATVYLRVEGDVVQDVSFEGSGLLDLDRLGLDDDRRAQGQDARPRRRRSSSASTSS